jgi:sugar diacid utilization regulator
MQNSVGIHNSQGIMYDYFIADLLDGNITNPKVIEERLKCIKWILQDNIYILTLHKKQNYNNSLLDICQLVSNLIYGSKAIVYNNYVVAVISRKRNDFPNENDLKCLIKLLESNEMYGGISRCFHNLSDICKYLKQSLKAIELGVSMKNKKVLFSYEEYSVYHLMSIFSTHNNLKDFCHPSIFALLDYDSRYNHQLIESLDAYLANSTSIEKASNAMGIHRNTMACRVKKIESITNLNIHDDEVLFRLLFSLKILKFIDSTRIN